MMAIGDIARRDALLPGDVVLDMQNHRPMQVTGYESAPAREVPEVWQSNINQEYHEIEPNEDVLRLVDIPTGSHYFVPEEVNRYPECRLGRVLTSPATGERRVQQKVVRAVLAHVVADMRSRDAQSVADAVLSVCREHWSDTFVSEISEFADSVSAPKGE